MCLRQRRFVRRVARCNAVSRRATSKKRKPAWRLVSWTCGACYTLEELAGDNVMFAATGVTTGDYLRGVRFFSGGAMTNSVVMRSKTRTIRFIEAIHHFDFKPEY